MFFSIADRNDSHVLAIRLVSSTDHALAHVLIRTATIAWGLTMAAYHTELPLNRYWVELAKSLFAAFIVRGSACTINDIFDRKFDAGVGQYIFLSLINGRSLTGPLERTKGRPLASGRVSVFAAVVYLILQYIAGLVVYVSYNEIAYVFIPCPACNHLPHPTSAGI